MGKLFQIQGSEKAKSRKPSNDPASAKHQRNKKGHGRNHADAYEGASIIDVFHPTLKPGDSCIETACDGRLYEMSEPGTLIRVKPGYVRRIAPLIKY